MALNNKIISPSKELLNAVGMPDEDNCINIYELMHFMKIWAFDKGFEIVERYCDARILNGELEEVHLVEMYGEDTFSPSRVFHCCEWILNETK